MADFDVELRGFEAALNELNQRIDALEELGDDRWLVGTGVEYAVYLEFGTSEMNPKPFVRPALRRVSRDVETIARDADDAGEIVQRIAFRLEAEIKQVITRKGLIDTGTLRASVRAVPNGTPRDLPGADEVDPSAEASVEVGT